jgi:membrane protein
MDAGGLEAGWRGRYEALREWLRCYALARVVVRATRAYHDHRCLYMGAALSFFAALAVIPLVYTAVIVLARFVGSTEAAQAQLRIVMDQYLIPGSTDEVLERVQVLLRRGGILGSGAWWSLTLLVWSGIRFYETLQSIFAAAWGWSRARPFLHRHGVAVGAFIGAGALLGVAIVLGVAASTFSHVNETIAGLPVAPALIALADALPFLLSIAVFCLVYKFIPPVDVPWKLAFVLGAGVACAWEMLRRVFTLFISASGIYQDIYGPLSSLMLLLVWVYASASIILYGAELGAAWQQDQASQRAARLDPVLPGLPAVQE